MRAVIKKIEEFGCLNSRPPWYGDLPLVVFVVDWEFSEFTQKAIIHGNYRNKVKKDGEEVKH